MDVVLPPQVLEQINVALRSGLFHDLEVWSSADEAESMVAGTISMARDFDDSWLTWMLVRWSTTLEPFERICASTVVEHVVPSPMVPITNGKSSLVRDIGGLFGLFILIFAMLALKP